MPESPPQRNHDHPSNSTSGNDDAIRRCMEAWYAINCRDLPWRRTMDPYDIWISEVMLQQTQVKTVKPYYHRFIHRFPDVYSLAAADLQSVLKRWEGLGYYSRARNLHKAAHIIANEKHGCFPDTWETVRQLPGIGDYIASAVLSIAFGKPYAVVDGNVKRVLARFFLVAAPVNQPASHRYYQELATRLLNRKNPSHHNQAMMELGALVCTPRKPDCPRCPVSKYCAALTSNVVGSYPKRLKRPQRPVRHVAVGAVMKKGRVLLVQRAENGLLGGFWEFPGGALDTKSDPKQACRRHIKSSLNLDVTVEKHVATVRHTYTHFKLRMDVYRCRWVAGRVYLRGPAHFKWMVPAKITDLPIHGAMHKALKHFL